MKYVDTNMALLKNNNKVLLIILVIPIVSIHNFIEK